MLETLKLGSAMATPGTMWRTVSTVVRMRSLTLGLALSRRFYTRAMRLLFGCVSKEDLGTLLLFCDGWWLAMAPSRHTSMNGVAEARAIFMVIVRSGTRRDQFH